MEFKTFNKIASMYDAPLTVENAKAVEISYVMGLVTEAAEIADIYKKHLAQNQPLNIEHIKIELGDIMWYIKGLLNVHGLTLEQVLQSNVDKLKQRYGEAYSHEAALTKKDKLNGGY